MEKPSKTNRLSADSMYEVTSAWSRIVIELQPEITHHGRKLAPGPALNGLVMQFLSLPYEEQVKFLTAGMRKYEKINTGAGGSVASERTSRSAPKRR